jgi:hypothetical protein
VRDAKRTLHTSHKLAIAVNNGKRQKGSCPIASPIVIASCCSSGTCASGDAEAAWTVQGIQMVFLLRHGTIMLPYSCSDITNAAAAANEPSISSMLMVKRAGLHCIMCSLPDINSSCSAGRQQHAYLGLSGCCCFSLLLLLPFLPEQ